MTDIGCVWQRVDVGSMYGCVACVKDKQVETGFQLEVESVRMVECHSQSTCVDSVKCVYCEPILLSHPRHYPESGRWAINGNPSYLKNYRKLATKLHLC